MDKYKFFEPLRVRFAETDLQGHVFFGEYLTYAVAKYEKQDG